MLRKTINFYDPNIARIFLPWAWKHPRYLLSFIRLRKSHFLSEKQRKISMQNNIKIPPFLIISITDQCNYQCKKCYAKATGTLSKQSKKPILTLMQWNQIIHDANSQGVFGFVLAGGEPFLFPDLLQIPQAFPQCFFIIFSNGSNLSKENIKTLKQLGNIAILISIEGGKILTNERRGENAYEKAMDTLHQLRRHGVIHGISTTITNQNYDYWLQEKHIDALIKQGIRIGVFIEHIPVSKNKEEMQLLLSPTQRNQFRKHMLSVRENKKIYIVHSPGDEEFFGGCVSAGRGFAHITPYGDITPCPISNIATHNLTTSSFIDAMKSPLFQSIRENEHLLETEGMPCALFAHPKEVDEIAKKVGAYRTNKK